MTIPVTCVLCKNELESYLNQFEYVESATAVIAKMKTIIPPVAWYIFRLTGRINLVNFWFKKLFKNLVLAFTAIFQGEASFNKFSE